MLKYIILIALILMPQLSCSACSGIRETVKWIEPVTSIDGLPLHDLAKTTLHYQVNTNTPKTIDYAASKLTGGGKKTGNFTALMDCATRDNTLTWWVTATDMRGNVSPIAGPVTRIIRR